MLQRLFAYLLNPIITEIRTMSEALTNAVAAVTAGLAANDTALAGLASEINLGLQDNAVRFQALTKQIGDLQDQAQANVDPTAALAALADAVGVINKQHTALTGATQSLTDALNNPPPAA